MGLFTFITATINLGCVANFLSVFFFSKWSLNLFVNSGTRTLSSTLRQFGSSVTTVCTENMSAEKKETAFGDQNKFANFFNVFNKK